MGVARWDLEWMRGSGWTARLVRRDLVGLNLGMFEPTILELRPIDVPTSVSPKLSVTGVRAEDHGSATVDVTPEQIEALPLRRYWYRITTGDPAHLGRPLTLLTGYVKIVDVLGGG